MRDAEKQKRYTINIFCYNTNTLCISKSFPVPTLSSRRHFRSEKQTSGRNVRTYDPLKKKNMAETKVSDFLDIYNLELQLRERINELHWKTLSLDEAQKELAETRRSLYETQTLLENERRSSNQLKIQLNSALVAARRMEEDKLKNQTLNVRLKTECETAEIERNFLVDQARTAKLENIELKIKIQELEANFTNSKMTNESLQASLIELKNSVSRLHATMQSNVGKLEREQEQLRKSFASSIQFGERVQACLKTSHAERQRDKKKIEKLQKLIDTLENAREASTLAAVTNDGKDIGTSHLQSDSMLQELRRKLENNSIDDKLAIIRSELRKADERLVKD